jgi:hypothetical protein
MKSPGRISSRQKFQRRWLLPCSNPSSSSSHSWAANEGSLQQNMSLTDCSNSEPKELPLPWLSNAVSSYWPSLLSQSRYLQLLFLEGDSF